VGPTVCRSELVPQEGYVLGTWQAVGLISGNWQMIGVVGHSGGVQELVHGWSMYKALLSGSGLLLWVWQWRIAGPVPCSCRQLHLSYPPMS
jgi:hypothetical protein